MYIAKLERQLQQQQQQSQLVTAAPIRRPAGLLRNFFKREGNSPAAPAQVTKAQAISHALASASVKQ